MKRIKQGQTRWDSVVKRGPDNRIELVCVLSCRVVRVTKNYVHYKTENCQPFELNVMRHYYWLRLFPTFRKAMRHAQEACKQTDRERDAEYLEAWGD